MINKILEKALSFTKEHSPELLISAGVGAMVTSTVLAVRATPKAIQLIEDEKADLGVTYLTKREIVETTWKQYIPAVGMGAVGAACIVLGTTQNMKRNTALATVYALSENTLREYQRKTVEIAGEEKAQEIEREVAKVRVKDHPIVVNELNNEYVISTGNGDTLIFDSLSGRYFRSSMNAVDKAINEINKDLLDEYVITVNDLYNKLDVPTIGAGGLIGWKSDKELVEVRYDSDVDQNGQPYLVLTFSNRPSPLQNSYASY